MAEKLELTVHTTREDLVRAMTEVETFLDTRDPPPVAAYAIQLAFEELGTNVVKYGYGGAGDHTFTSVIELTEPARLTMTDAGHPFDPWHDAPRPDLEARLEDRPIGGLGLHMVREMAANVAYERRDNLNVVTVTFNAETD